MNLSAAYLKKQQEWLTEGEQRGVNLGRQEERQEIAIVSLREGLSPEVVAKITGLSLEEIEQLRENLRRR
jgi:predicted transposase/invertase (TIGR01784 family)